jgi:monoterpene epsilon-lactone hydrolase
MSMNKVSVPFVMALLGSMVSPAHEKAPEVAPVTVEADGTVHIPPMTVPYSFLASPEAKRNFLDLIHDKACVSEGLDKHASIEAKRKRIDDCLMRPGVERLRAVFAVDIKPKMIGGVQTDVVQPADGVPEKNKRRVLINLHGGGFEVGARWGGQIESIPVASLGAIRVITVDYREGPEYRFPAASEDVVAVYRELLKSYKPKNIGIYGCSAGGLLTAEMMAWLHKEGMPLPGAIGMFCGGGVWWGHGDSAYVNAELMNVVPLPNPSDENLSDEESPYFSSYFKGVNPNDSLAFPALSPELMRTFPPSLLIAGTRDLALSSVVYTHSVLISQGVDAELHVWEGAAHAIFAQPVVDPSVPETRQAWDVIVKFFDSKLGK